MIYIFLFYVELLLLEGHFIHNTHTQMHTRTYLCPVLQNFLDEKIWFWKVKQEWKTMRGCQKKLHIPLLDLSCYHERVILVITHTQMHTSIYLCSVLQKLIRSIQR